MSEAKRREVWAVHDGSNYLRFKSEAAAKETSKLYGRAVILFREVLPGDPDPEEITRLRAIEAAARALVHPKHDPDASVFARITISKGLTEVLRAALAKMKEPPRG